MQQNEDLILVREAQSGDRDAFDKLYQKYKKVILNYLYRMFNNRSLAEEITQDTFIKVYLNLDKYKPTGTFSSWVYAIARNLAKNEIRKLSKKKNISLDAPLGGSEDLTLNDVLKSDAFDAEDVVHNKELEAQIRGALEELPAQYREVITLCVIQGRSYEEAAEALDCPKSTVAVRLFRARKAFREIIERVTREKDEVRE